MPAIPRTPILAVPLALAAAVTMAPTPLLAVPPHTSIGECYDFVIEQYNKDGDEDGLEFGLDDCDDAYAEEAAALPIGQLRLLRRSKLGGGLVILAVPQSLSAPGTATDVARPSRP